MSRHRTNKLVRRSETILAQLTGHRRDKVREALSQARGSVKLAFLLLEGSDPDEARAALEQTGGDLRAAKTSSAPTAAGTRRSESACALNLPGAAHGTG